MKLVAFEGYADPAGYSPRYSQAMRRTAVGDVALGEQAAALPANIGLWALAIGAGFLAVALLGSTKRAR